MMMSTKLILVSFLQYMYVNYISVKLKKKNQISGLSLNIGLLSRSGAAYLGICGWPTFRQAFSLQLTTVSVTSSLTNMDLTNPCFVSSFCTLTSGHQHLCSQRENESYTEKRFLSQEKGKNIPLLL